MHTACDIVYDLPSTKTQKFNMCNVVICILVILIVYNSLSQTSMCAPREIPKIVSSMAANLLNATPLPTAEETSISEKIVDLKKENLPLSADAKGSKGNKDAYKTSTDAEKKDLAQKVEAEIKSSKEVVVMFWAPWCGHCHNAMKPFSEASQLRPNTKFLMVNAEAVDKKLLSGDNPIVKLTHFPFICRMENGKVTKLFDSAPTPEGIADEMDPLKNGSKPDPLDLLFQ